MIIIDDYAIEQLFTQNRIIIYLPSLFHTTNSTMEKFSWTRKERLTTEELATILQLVKNMFEKGEKENETN